MIYTKTSHSLKLLAIPLAITLAACSNNASDTNTVENEAKDKQNALNAGIKFTGKLPISPRVLTGKFENGITYIIRKNSVPENRAELRLVINAGSILEEDNQQGFAHFAEHMAFNGTTDFKKQEVVDYVESIGMRFGAHLNAHTSFDETVYKLQLPTDNEKTLETGVHILENWAHKISFEGDEIDKERGVVLEEMRARKGASDRILQKQLPIIAKDSQYALRLPIGKKDILVNGSHENLVQFYKDWYRPDLMAVVAVGDFEPSEMKALLEKYFAKIKPHTNKKERINYTIPANEAPLISIETDVELPRIIARVQIKHPLFEPSTYEELRTALAAQLYTAMLNARFGELALKADTAFVGAGSSFGRGLDASSAFSIGAAIKPGKVNAALEAVLREENRVLQHGFTSSELNRAKANLARVMQKNFAEMDTAKSNSYAGEYVRHFMKNEAILGRELEFEASQYFIPEITLSEVNQLGVSWFTEDNRIITITAPASEAPLLPTNNEVITLWDDVLKEQTAPYQDSKVLLSLMDKKPVAGSVVDKKYNEALQTHYWTLSNGAKVIIKQTDFKKDQILFLANKKGGSSALSDADFTKTILASTAIDYMGVAEYDQLALSKFMQNKKFALRTTINELSTSLSGYTSIKDSEHFMQMLHLKLSSPRKDKVAFDTLKSRIAPSIENQLQQPNYVFSQAVNKAQYGDNVRFSTFDIEVLKKQDLDTSMNVYHQLFDDAAGFTFILIGSVNLAQTEQLVNTYIASLPSVDAKPEVKILPYAKKAGMINVTVKKGLEEKAQVKLAMYGETAFSHEEQMKFSVMKSALNAVLRERIREEKGGVYGVGVSGGLSRLPQGSFELSISFTCDPNRVDELIDETHKVINEFITKNVDEKHLISFKEASHKSRETNLKVNGFWQKHLNALEVYNGDVLSFAQYDALVDSMTLTDIQEAANSYLTSENSLKATLLPEDKKD